MSDANDEWLPFSARRSEAGRQEFVRLSDGVPGWLRESLWKWLSEQMHKRALSNNRTWYTTPDEAKIRRAERILKISSGWTSSGESHPDRVSGLSKFRAVLYSNPESFLGAVDLALSELDPKAPQCAALETVLEEGASAWRVGRVSDRPGLVERIDATVQLAAETTGALEPRAGRLLADAWKHAFSMNRDPSAAYRCAVRAVEAAAAPVISPNDTIPTLGKMISAFRNKPEKWDFSFKVDSAADPKNVLLGMLQILWTNEYSRHVDPDIQAPLHVSQEEAESAIVLAVTLVNWFVSGSVSRHLPQSS
ncbi:hypothetical protein F8R89_17360 [Streptomyces sp. SS1-1]|uniref:hypothetical protein n=1 Tax=Streptomyces sp. SS1-1 TaxID=2651869 RepID=UPI001250B1BB|nr:hypothetical protein [Streptomyces sp. SS1-1]KAB2973616.1 hypothetical protein F8R89_17360 [Streptomyces sp. SS1-1]